MSSDFLMWIDQNCTHCTSFVGDLWLKTDEVYPVMPFAQQIQFDCSRHGKISNQKLYVCENFQYDANKPEIVRIEDTFRPSSRFFVRIPAPLPEEGPNRAKAPSSGTRGADNIDPLTRSIYDLVCRVYSEHGMKSLLVFVVARISCDTGVSKEMVWRRVMNMIESGYLARGDVDGAVYVEPPPVFVSIAEVKEIGKRKVSV